MKNKLFDLDKFNFIVENSNFHSNRLHNEEIPKFNFFSKVKPIFKYFRINENKYNENKINPKFHTPVSIMFFDKFYSYHIAIIRIKNKLETVKYKYTKDMNWKSIPKVSYRKISKHELKRLSKSFYKLEQLIQENLESQLEYKRERKEYIENLPYLPIEKRKAFMNLAKICLNNKIDDELIHFIEGLKDYTEDEIHFTTLNFVMDYLDRNDIHFIMGLDWKFGINDLVWRISSSLKQNFDTIIDLPSENDFPENTAISWEGVFETFEKVLKKENFHIGFIDTDSPEFIMLIHKTEDLNFVSECVNIIGYNYINTFEIMKQFHG